MRVQNPEFSNESANPCLSPLTVESRKIDHASFVQTSLNSKRENNLDTIEIFGSNRWTGCAFGRALHRVSRFLNSQIATLGMESKWRCPSRIAVSVGKSHFLPLSCGASRQALLEQLLFRSNPHSKSQSDHRMKRIARPTATVRLTFIAVAEIETAREPDDAKDRMSSACASLR
jgi:hypothetical protein